MVFDQSEFILLALGLFPLFLWRQRKRSRVAILVRAILYVYVAGVISQTLLPIPLQFDTNLTYPENHIVTELFQYFVLRDALLNILLTLPMGLLYPLIWRHSWRRTIGFAIGMPVIIESLQFVVLYLTLEYTRVVDVSDVLFNFLGVIGGYLLYRLFFGPAQRAFLDNPSSGA